MIGEHERDGVITHLYRFVDSAYDRKTAPLQKGRLMNILSLLGSPRVKGNTDRILTWTEDSLREQGHTVDRVNLIDYTMVGCLETHYDTGAGGPHLKGNEALVAAGYDTTQDQTDALLDRMVESDLVLFATPLYCWDFTAQFKLLIDRMFTLVSGSTPETQTSRIQDKPLALLVTAAGPVENNADLILEVFDRLAQYVKARNVGHLVIPFCSSPDKIGDGVREQALEFAGELARVHK